MADEIAIAGLPDGVNAVAWIFTRSNAHIWNVHTSAFEVFNDTAKGLGYYDIDLAEQGGSRYFTGDFPVLITAANTYNIIFNTRGGTSPSFAYVFATSSSIVWAGSSEDPGITGLNWTSLLFVKGVLGIQDTSLDDQITALLPVASAAGNVYCDRAIKSVSFSSIYRGTRNVRGLSLGQWPVTAVSSVIIDCFSAAPVSIDPSTSIFVNESGIMYLLPTSTVQLFDSDFIRVDFTAGNAVVPNDLQYACALIIQAMIFTGRMSQIVKSQTTKDVSYSWQNPLQADSTDPLICNAKVILDKYRTSDLVLI